MTHSSFEFKALNDVAALIKEELTSQYTHAGDGTGLLWEDAAAAGMRWAERVGSVKALKKALSICEEVERQLMGQPKKKAKEG